MATKAELAETIVELVPGLVIKALETPRYVDRTGDDAGGKPLTHFEVQGHAAAIAAARNSAAVLGRVSGLETAIAALAQGRGIDKALLTEVSEAAESGVRRGLEGAVVTVELGG